MADIERFKLRLQESPTERAMQAAESAIDDLKLAVWTAKTHQQLREIRVSMERMIGTLTAISSVALTCIEHLEDGR